MELIEGFYEGCERTILGPTRPPSTHPITTIDVIGLSHYVFAVRGRQKKSVGQEVPFGRMGTADDLTGMAIFLASPDSEYVVAQTYNVDGGNWMS